MKKKEKLYIRYLKGICFGILAEALCLLICSLMIVLMRGSIILKLVISLCTLVITLGIYFNWTYYACKRDKDMIKYHGIKYSRAIPIKMALIAPLPSYIMLILLYLMKAGIIKDMFNYYLLFNMWVLPFVDTFTDSRSISGIPISGIIGISFLIILQPTTIIATYLLTMKEIDLYRIIFYKKESK